jgi:hypothetical protein
VTIKLDFAERHARIAAAEFIAGLAREGIMFTATPTGDWLLIELTGGF